MAKQCNWRTCGADGVTVTACECTQHVGDRMPIGPYRGPPIDIPSIMQADGVDRGVAAERARVVAWLKEVERGPIAYQLALRIERGEHVSGRST